MPYNAHKATFIIFDQYGGEVHKQIISDVCNGIPAGILKWDGCKNGQPLNTDVYVWLLILENCHDSHVFAGDVTLLGPAICNNEFQDPSPKEESLTSDGDLGTGVNFSIYPNPFKDIISVAFTGTTETNAKIYVRNSRLDILKTLDLGEIKGQEEITETLWLDYLPAGLYFFTIETESEFITRKVVKID